MVAATPEIEAHGIRARLPDGWSGHIFREPASPPDLPNRAPVEHGPIMHAGNFAIPLDDAAFGSTLTEEVTPGRIAVMFVEYLPDDVLRPGQEAYAPQGVPSELSVSDFSPTCLQVMRDGQAGLQRFFSIGDTRLGVLYAVLGTSADADTAVEQATQFVTSLEFASTPNHSDFRPAPVQP